MGIRWDSMMMYHPHINISTYVIAVIIGKKGRYRQNPPRDALFFFFFSFSLILSIFPPYRLQVVEWAAAGRRDVHNVSDA